MKKLTLDVDALVVESFATDATRGRGTVLGLRIDEAQVIGVAEGKTEEGCNSEVETWCYDGGCTGDEPCTVYTWTTPDFCRTDRGCVETQ